MKTKVLLLALLSGFVFSVSAQEFKPQVGFSTEKGYKTNFKKNKAGDNWFISVAGGASMLLGDQNNKADFGNRLNFAPQFSFAPTAWSLFMAAGNHPYRFQYRIKHLAGSTIQCTITSFH